MANIETCKAISDVFGPSGYEHEVAAFIMDAMKDFPVQKDGMQNVYVSLPGNTGNRPVVMLDAHMDEVGFMVQSITANGLIKIVPLGGWVEHNIPAHTFLIKNKDGKLVKAVSGSKPPHFMSAAERNAPLSMNNILLDVGVTCREDATELLGIEPGQPIVPDVTCEYNEATGMLLGKTFDCRLGCEAIMETMCALKDAKLDYDVVAAFSTQEEVGTRGAHVTADVVKPHLAICLEGSPADDNFTPETEAQGVLKKGVQIRYRDNSMVANPAWVAYVREAAVESGITHQCTVRTGGGTNGGAIHMAAGGIPVTVLGIPVRYAHTHYGYSAVADVDSAIALATAVLKKLTAADIEALNHKVTF